jgi:hypothetical protein
MTRVHTIGGMGTLLQVYAAKRLTEGLAPDGEWEGRVAMKPDFEFGSTTVMAKAWCKNCRNIMFGNEMAMSVGVVADLAVVTTMLDHLKDSIKNTWRVGRHSCRYEAWRRERRPWMDRVCTMSPARLPGHPHYAQYVEDMKRYKELED